MRRPTFSGLAPLALCLALPLSLLGAAPAPADALKVDIDKLGLTRAELRVIGTNRSRALTTFYGQALRISADGVVTRALIKGQREMTRASTRGRALGGYLSYDLNGDMTISAEEFALLDRIVQGYRRGQLLVLRDTGDLNGDGAVDLDEMRAAVDARYGPGARRSSNYLNRRDDLLMKMDVNGDGRVTLPEIDAVVTAVTAPRPAEAPKDPLGDLTVIEPDKKAQP